MARTKAEPPPRVDIEPGAPIQVVGGAFDGQRGEFMEQTPSGYCYVMLPGKDRKGERIMLKSLVPTVARMKGEK